MELERDFIERTGFSAVRKGYDPEEVDRHLREIAQAVEDLKQAPQPSPAAPPSLAGAAAEQVRTIVEAAENSAAQIESDARSEAERVTTEARQAARQERDSARAEAERVRSEAEAAARESRERAEVEAAAHVAKVQEAAAAMRERADTVESDLEGLVDQLRGTIESLVGSVRSSAGSLESELEGMQAGLAVLGESSPGPTGAGTPTYAADAGDEVDEAYAEAPHLEAAAVEEELEYEDELDTGEDEAPVEDLLAAEEPERAASGEGDGTEGARLIALNMALNGTPREETARYLEENFSLEDQDAILDEVYARVGS